MQVKIIAHPNSKKPRIEEDLLGTLHVYVGSPPLEGRANKETRDSLAKHFNIPRSGVILLSGQKT
ncbi:MAG: DUF167 domain-containing protein, partial [Ignavibacteria bacterium]|nr:DUF167 domain-containing protein [Ignavibacteria bacterium]